jgi:hypothetical protein
MQQFCTCGSVRGASGQLASLPRPPVTNNLRIEILRRVLLRQHLSHLLQVEITRSPRGPSKMDEASLFQDPIEDCC